MAVEITEFEPSRPAPGRTLSTSFATEGDTPPSARDTRSEAPLSRGRLVRRALMIADAVGLAGAFLAAELLFSSSQVAVDRLDAASETWAFLVTVPIWLVLARLSGLYDRDEKRTDPSTLDDVLGISYLATVGAWLFFMSSWLTTVADPAPPKLITFWALAIVSVVATRAVARALCRRTAGYRQRTIIVGSGEVSRLVARKLAQHPEYGIELVGFVDDARRRESEAQPLLGTLGDLPRLVEEQRIDRVVIAFTRTSDARALPVIRLLRLLPVQIDIVPRFFALLTPDVDVHAVEGLPLVGLQPFKLSRTSLVFKRIVDVVISASTLVLLSPVLALLAAAVKVDSPGPVLFKQTRMGMGERTFGLYKFRTMVCDAEVLKPQVAHLNMHEEAGGDGRMFKIRDDPRVTRVGRVLRRYSLDELPQLMNVVKGEMSLVGPRPLILDEDNHVRSWARHRLSVMPGMTGPWQALGRNTIPFDEMVNLDYLYATEWSVLKDLKWIARTIPSLIRARSAY